MVQSPRLSHCKNSPGSRDECRTAPGGRTKPTYWAINKPGCRQLGNNIHRRHLLLLSRKAVTHFTIPWRVEDWVYLDGWLHTPRWLTCRKHSPIHSSSNWVQCWWLCWSVNHYIMQPPNVYVLSLKTVNSKVKQPYFYQSNKNVTTDKNV